MGLCSSREAVASDVDNMCDAAKVAETFDVICNADECATAIERATRAMDPPLEVYEGILQLIAVFAGPPYPYATRFDTGPQLEYFDISNGGLTATRNFSDFSYGWRYVCASPSFNSGDVHVGDFVGVHECVFRIDKGGGYVSVGVVPVGKVTQDKCGYNIGQFYGNGGFIYGPGHYRTIYTGVKYGYGDAIAVTLNLDANTVAFAKNGAAVPTDSTGSIARDEEHHFAFSACYGEHAVTITSMK